MEKWKFPRAEREGSSKEIVVTMEKEIVTFKDGENSGQLSRWRTLWRSPRATRPDSYRSNSPYAKHHRARRAKMIEIDEIVFQDRDRGCIFLRVFRKADRIEAKQLCNVSRTQSRQSFGIS